MFTPYAPIVKNLRGTIYIEDLDENTWTTIKRLIRKFRYRDLGLPPTIYNKHRGQLRDYTGDKPFRLPVYPIEELKGLVDIILYRTIL